MTAHPLSQLQAPDVSPAVSEAESLLRTMAGEWELLAGEIEALGETFSQSEAARALPGAMQRFDLLAQRAQAQAGLLSGLAAQGAHAHWDALTIATLIERVPLAALRDRLFSGALGMAREESADAGGSVEFFGEMP